MAENNPKSFWSRPEGTTGALFLLGGIAALGYFILKFSGALFSLFSGLAGMVAGLAVLGVLIYMALDPKVRNLISYMYKGIMRKITGIFITLDPIGILKSYVSDLESNLKKMGKQIGNIRGQMRKLKTIVESNNKEIEQNMLLAKKAKELNNESQLILSSRKAARLKESNKKYVALHKKLSVLYKVLSKMHSNSEILIEDTKDQVRVKEQERKAIRTSHSAMRSAISIIKGDPDKRAMFDQAMEHIADDVANKVGEMEQFMAMSSDFMDSIDLQNGVFEEKGLKMLEEYEKKSTLLLLGGVQKTEDILDLNEERGEIDYEERSGDSKYENLFD